MSVLAEAPPAREAAAVERHGKCRLIICINGDIYIIKLLKDGSTGKIWEFRKRTGERAGVKYRAGRLDGALMCSCPDNSQSGVECKHLRALVAQRLVSRPRPRRKEGA